MHGTTLQKKESRTRDYSDYGIDALEAMKGKVRAEIKERVHQGNALITEINREIAAKKREAGKK